MYEFDEFFFLFPLTSNKQNQNSPKGQYNANFGDHHEMVFTHAQKILLGFEYIDAFCHSECPFYVFPVLA